MSSTDALNAGLNTIRDWGIRSAGVPHITYQNMHAILRKQTLVFYPVWVARYTYKERGYFATVDGVTGKVLSGRAPGDPLKQAIIGTIGSGAGGVLAGVGVRFLIGGSEGPGAGLLVAGIVILAAGYWFFRHGGQIVQGDIKWD